MSLKKKAVAGFSWSMAQQFGISGIQFLVQIVLARIILPKEFGTFGLIYAFYTIGNSISDSGMSQSIIRSDDLEEDDYGTIFLTNLALSIIIYLTICLAGPSIAKFYNQPIISNLLWVYCFSIILTSFSTIQIYRLTKSLDFKTQTKIHLPSLIISGIVGIVLGQMGYGVWALVIMQVVQNLFLAVQYWFFTGWKPRLLFNQLKFKNHFNFGYKLTLSGLLSTISTNLLPLIIGKYFTTTQVGYFTKSNEMKGFPIQMITAALNKVTYPLFSEVKNNHEKLKSAYKQIQSAVVYILGASMLLLILLATPIFNLLLGPNWLPAVPYFQILCITGILFPVHMYNLNILKVKGRSDQFLKAGVIKQITLLVFVFYAIKFGIYALLIALVANNVVSIFVNTYYGTKHMDYKLTEQLKDIFHALLPSVISFLICLQALKHFNFNDIFTILIFTLLFGILFFSFSKLLNSYPLKVIVSLIPERFKKFI